MRQTKVIIFVIIWTCLIVITTLFNMVYFTYIRDNPNEYTRSIKEIDDDWGFDQPFSYITPLTSSNISSIEDLFTPRSFDNDRVTLTVPTDDRYAYSIALNPGDELSGNLSIYSDNGTEISYSRWQKSPESLGGVIFSEIKNNLKDNITLQFKGTGIIIFLSVSTSNIFTESSDYSGLVENNPVSFIVPFELADNLPDDRRIVTEIKSQNDNHFKLRFYHQFFHLIEEKEGTESMKFHLRSGYSPLIYIVSLSDGDISLRFGYSSPIEGEKDNTPTYLCGGVIILHIIVITFIIYTVKSFRKEKTKATHKNKEK